MTRMELPRVDESIQLLRLLEVTQFPVCSNVEINWYLRVPANPPPGELKVEMLTICLHIEISWYVNRNESYTMLFGQSQYAAG